MNKPVWTAEVTLGQAEAAALIEEQFPALRPARLSLLGEGWDNVVFRVNDRWVFRFPRRTLSVALLEAEGQALPRLAPLLPVPIPVPRFFGRPSAGFSWPFLGYGVLEGLTACRAGLGEAERARLAAPLGRFVGALHGALEADPALEPLLLGDEIGRADLEGRAATFEERLAEVTGELPVPRARLLERARALVESAPAAALCPVHGDLYARHLLVDEDRALAGVIDWGDVHLGDPALDLSVVFAFLPAAAHPDFFAAYGRPVSEADRDRARFRALYSGLMLLHYGRSIGDAPLEQAGELALRSAIA